jgi:hypothetical protein
VLVGHREVVASVDRQSVTPSGPIIDSRLVAALERLDDTRWPIAETHRRLAAVARELQLVRPSYEQVRTLVHRARRRGRYPSAGDVLLDIMFQTQQPAVFGDWLVGTYPIRRN